MVSLKLVKVEYFGGINLDRLDESRRGTKRKLFK